MEPATPFLPKQLPLIHTSARPRCTRPLTLLFCLLSLFILPLLFHHRPHLRALLSPPPQPLPVQRPLLIYPKPRKTGSTFISSMLGTAVLRSGGRIAPCEVAGLMDPRADFYGLVRGYDLLGCHTGLASVSVRALTRLPREVVFVTSIREPRSWFASAAVWVREKKTGVVVDTERLFREAIDDALDGDGRFLEFRRLFLGNYALNEKAGISEIQTAANLYSFVFDHATAEQDVNEALVELGYEPSMPSSRREGVYDPKWFDGYRTEQVRNATTLERLIYDHFKKVRGARKAEHVPWANLERRKTKVVYSALSRRGRERKQSMRVAKVETYKSDGGERKRGG